MDTNKKIKSLIKNIIKGLCVINNIYDTGVKNIETC